MIGRNDNKKAPRRGFSIIWFCAPLPPEIILNEKQRNELIKKADLRFGYKIAYFFELWLEQHDNWTGLYGHCIGSANN